ncbi:protein SCAR3 isoform X2 [Humulus lupulus]|uniref:protein SCAR3 isoform X2 n=1 Tax=Humulus lupulus TaxID=3486 RepID=UPI002B41773A|nr:protein SCAR3 isoform X2 [Humulus lupulus]
MPLVRFQVRNEFGLGNSELHSRLNKEDPKAVLDGAAVAGLVGILRQLGDLAEFAGEVFHGLQEQVMATSSRSHKLMVRVQRIEAALPPLEKVVLAQTSHIHFAYTAGSEWHPRIHNERHHFINNDLPHFIMDSYEECRRPPHLHLLDKFDTGGPGSCLKRYSDPTFFKRVSAVSDEVNAEKNPRDRKARRSKKKRSSKQKGDVSRGASMSDSHNNSMPFIPPTVEARSSPSQATSTVDTTLKYDRGNHLNSFDSRAESGYIECVFHPSSSVQAGEQEFKDSPPFRMTQHNDTLNSVFADEHVGFMDDRLSRSSLQEPITSGSSCVTWDEKAEIMDPSQESNLDETLDLHQNLPTIDANGYGAGNITIVDQMEIFGDKSMHERISDQMEMLGNKTIHERTVDQMEMPGDENIHKRTVNQLEMLGEQNIHERTVDQMEMLGDKIIHRTVDQTEMHSEQNIHERTADELEIFGEQNIHERSVDQMEILAEQDVHERSVGQMEMLGDENIHESASNSNEIDEIESETDNFMDALNTIESDAENDLDYQTKREVEQFPTIFNNDVEDRMHELNVNWSDRCDDPPTSTFDNASFTSTNKEEATDLHDSVSLESCVHEQLPTPDISPNKEESCDLPNSFSSDSHDDVQISESSTDHDAVITRSEDIYDGSKLESVMSTPSSSVTKPVDVQDPSGKKTTSAVHDSEESQADLPRNHSMRFWTNGGLLGLEPSKPPDFSMSSTVTQDSVNSSKTDAVGQLNHTYELKDEMHGGNSNISPINIAGNGKDSSTNTKCSTSCGNDEEDGTSTKKTSQGSSTTCLDSTHGNADDSHMQNGNHTNRENNANETSVYGTGKVLPVAPNVKNTFTKTSEEHDENSSLVFGLSRRLLSNGFSRKVSDAKDEKFESISSMNDSIWEQGNEHHRAAHQRLPERAFKEHFGFGSAANSPSSSPPLEHMKISFHPIDSFETSTLKLKFSDGTQSHESIGDMFPSFQLIPKPAIPPHNYGSDSDDDTFCRSSPCMSDDCLSQHSESNSEQWECGETMEGEEEDHGVYYPLHGISSAEHISGSLDFDKITNGEICYDGGFKRTNSGNGLELSLCDPILDLPSFDAVKPAMPQETENDSDPKNLLDSRCHADPSPIPPPLPPAQWRVSKPHMDEAEDITGITSEDFRNELSAKLLASMASQKPKEVPAGQQNDEELTVKPKTKKLNSQKEIKQAPNNNGIDEREDFLQQIRTKSFNLRRTVTAKPTTTTPAPAANNKVTAIIEKANAIRQAVGSDDGEEDDDTWSDI